MTGMREARAGGTDRGTNGNEKRTGTSEDGIEVEVEDEVEGEGGRRKRREGKVDGEGRRRRRVKNGHQLKPHQTRADASRCEQTRPCTCRLPADRRVPT